MEDKILTISWRDQMSEIFFEEQKEHSKIKSRIVSEYFPVWAKIVSIKSNVNKVGFVDLYCGKGKYEDGSPSTPLLILETVINNEFAEIVQFIFNDKTSTFINELEAIISNFSSIDRLHYKPIFMNKEVSDEILEDISILKDVPSIYFLDPWGYKGLSRQLISELIKAWGSECIFFFNYNRINPAISNKCVIENMEALFGTERLEQLQKQLKSLNPIDKEILIINELCKLIKEKGGKYVLPFCFKDTEKDRTSHYVVFVDKHPRGYALIKEIMSKYSEKDNDNIPTFTFDPKYDPQLKFSFNRPIDDLCSNLYECYLGRKLTFKHLYDQHQQTTRFIKDNYKSALIKLEQVGKILVDKPIDKRIRNGKITLGDNRVITFKK